MERHSPNILPSVTTSEGLSSEGQGATCEAHLARRGASVPAFRNGLCRDCFFGKSLEAIHLSGAESHEVVSYNESRYQKYYRENRKRLRKAKRRRYWQNRERINARRRRRAAQRRKQVARFVTKKGTEDSNGEIA